MRPTAILNQLRAQSRAQPRLRLGTAVMLVFALLSLPPLLFILVYGHHRNEVAIVASLDRQLERTMDQSVRAVSNLVGTVGKVMAIVGDAVAAGPDHFRTDASYDYLWRALVAADQIDALYVSFEDGYHRVVSRLDDDRRRSDPKIPKAANWHASYMDSFAAGQDRARHRRFFSTWREPAGDGYSVPSQVDVRKTPCYVQAKRTLKLAVNEPSINPDTGSPVMPLGWPIVRQGRFIGFVGANMTLRMVSAYLRDNSVSEHSVTVIVDGADRVIAHSDPAACVRVVAGHTEFTTVDKLADTRLVEALAHRQQARHAPYRFTASSGQEMSVASKPFPAEFGKNWEIVIVAPTDDFVGDLKATNKAVSTIIAVLIALELGLIFVLARRMSSDIELISSRFQSIRDLDFSAVPYRRSHIGEIAELQNGFLLLLNALGSFGKFVPLGVVRQFVSSGQSVMPGVEQKVITALFCDLEGFSEHSEHLLPNDLLFQLTQYFSAVTSAVTQEGGTVDKFIGDAVMALWGAPTAQPDHCLRACAAALRAKRRMAALQTAWRAEGRPAMRVRIGLHTAEVLVGNIGSDDRLSYTAIGDGVNVSSRLEGMNKTFGTTICISDSLYAEIGDQIVARPLRLITVKGRRQEFMAYELLGLAGTDDLETMASEADIALARMSKEAVGQRLQGNLQACADLYRTILDQFPNDTTTRILLAELGADGG